MARNGSGSVNRASQQTSIEAVEKAALELLAVRGFDDTSAEEIAAAAGISRRTFFRYFGTKNNIPFGNYAALLRELEDWLLSQPDDRPMFEVIVEAVVRFNRAHTDGPVAHRERMELIMHTPALRANAALVNAEWQAVLARYAATDGGAGRRPGSAARGPRVAGRGERGLRAVAAGRVERPRRGHAARLRDGAGIADLEAGKAPPRCRKRRSTSGR